MKILAFLVLLFVFSEQVFAQQPVFDLKQKYQEVQEKLATDPDNINLQMDLAYLLAEVKKIPDAVQIYKNVFAKHPQNKRAVVELCSLLTMLRQQTEALHYCTAWTQIDSTSFLAFDNLGLSYFRFGNYHQALKNFTQALVLNPNSLLVKNHLGQTYLALKQNEIAIEYLQKVIEQELQQPVPSATELAYLYHSLYVAFKNTKKYEEAYDAISRTHSLSQDGMFLGKRISAYMAKHQLAFFFLGGFIVLLASYYFGKRLNRFLKNED